MNPIPRDPESAALPISKAAATDSIISSRETAITAVLKLAEVTFRLLFLLAVLLLLDLKTAGQFGLLNTLIAIFSLCAGFERWGVVWRSLAGMNRLQREALIASTLRFFQFNYVVLSPLFITVAHFWIGLTPYQIGLGFCIAIIEQLTVGIYWLATVQGKYRWLLIIAAGKNAVILLILSVIVFILSWTLTITLVLEIWTVACLVSLFAFGRAYHGSRTERQPNRNFADILAQYRESQAHFITGFAAFSSGQIDRVVVGAAAGLELTGIYFKNVFLAASVYAAATIFLHNRAVPAIYSAVAAHRYGDAVQAVRRESVRSTVAYAGLILALQLLIQVPGVDSLLTRFSISANYLAGLLFAFSLRTLADFNCSFLNACHHEKLVLGIHTSTTVFSVILILLLTKVFGLMGTVWAMIVGCGILFISSEVYKKRILLSVN